MPIQTEYQGKTKLLFLILPHTFFLVLPLLRFQGKKRLQIVASENVTSSGFFTDVKDQQRQGFFFQNS